MANYAIDTGDGNELTAGIQGYDQARAIAQQFANERGEPVYLYEIGKGDPEEPAESEEIAPEVVS